MLTKLSNRKIRAYESAGVYCVALTIGFLSAAASAQDEEGVTHYIDTNTDRVPALTVFPKYPSIARRDRIEGEATVCFKIKANGKIARPIVTERTHRIFAKPALRAIRKSNYEALDPGQVPAAARTCRIFRFRLSPILVKNNRNDEV